jgi:hypothetical protein
MSANTLCLTDISVPNLDRAMASLTELVNPIRSRELLRLCESLYSAIVHNCRIYLPTLVRRIHSEAGTGWPFAAISAATQ